MEDQANPGLVAHPPCAIEVPNTTIGRSIWGGKGVNKLV